MRTWHKFALAVPTALAAASLVLTGVAAGSGTASVTEHDDTGYDDTGDLPGDARLLSSAVGSVSGSVDRAGDIDLYRFCAGDQGFTVSTVNGDTAIADTELFVFHADGTALRYNDDWAGTWQSTVVVGPEESSGGRYLVAVGSRYNRALNADGTSLFVRSTQKQVGPAPGLADLALDHWSYSSESTGTYRIDFTGTADCGPAGPVEVDLDVKPGSEDDPINLRSRGRIPMALLGSPEFDVHAVDVETFRAGPGGAALADEVTVADVNGDGIGDLLGHVHTQDLELGRDTGELCVDAHAADVHVRGCDTITVR